MTQLWTILSATGDVLCPSFETPSVGSHPKDNGWPWVAGQTATRISATPDPVAQSFAGGTWGEDAAKVEAILVDRIKADAEARKAAATSPGAAKQAEYAAKRMEVLAWDALGGTAAAILAAFNLLPVAAKALRFEYAAADAARFGDTPAAAIARFRAGITAASAASANAAIEAKAVADVKAASTAALKRSAAAKVVWQ